MESQERKVINMKKTVKDSMRMATDVVMFGAGASVLGEVSKNMTDSTQKRLVGAAGTLYAANLVKRVAEGSGSSKKGRKRR